MSSISAFSRDLVRTTRAGVSLRELKRMARHEIHLDHLFGGPGYMLAYICPKCDVGVIIAAASVAEMLTWSGYINAEGYLNVICHSSRCPGRGTLCRLTHDNEVFRPPNPKTFGTCLPSLYTMTEVEQALLSDDVFHQSLSRHVTDLLDWEAQRRHYGRLAPGQPVYEPPAKDDDQ